MCTVTPVASLIELVKLWPRLLKCAKADTPCLNSEWFLRGLLRSLASGAVFVVRADSGVIGCCAVEQTANDSLILHTIPNDKGTGTAKACLEAIKEYAEEVGCTDVMVTTRNFSGSSFRYFKHALGFRQYSVTFNLKV